MTFYYLPNKTYLALQVKQWTVGLRGKIINKITSHTALSEIFEKEDIRLRFVQTFFYYVRKKEARVFISILKSQKT